MLLSSTPWKKYVGVPCYRNKVPIHGGTKLRYYKTPASKPSALRETLAAKLGLEVDSGIWQIQISRLDSHTSPMGHRFSHRHWHATRSTC